MASSHLHERTLLLGPGKPLALLLYLHSTPTRRASREHLIDLLWADLEPVSARHALRQTLWYLRQRLGPGCVRTDNGDVVLALAVTCDRDDFVAAVSSGTVDAAVDQYRGHFLPGFAVPGGLEFEHWADAERTRLRLMFLRTAESAVRARLSTGHVREARELALRVRDGNPQTESAWRLYMETLVAGHDTVGALAEAERLLTLLRQDGRTPDATTRALLRSLQREPDSGAPSPSGLVAELVGREREFAMVVESWQAARRGRAMLLHISAPAGLGKTRLMLDVQARLAAAGGHCVYVRANPGERAVPLALAAELAAGLGAVPGAIGISTASAGALIALNPSLSSVFDQPADSATGDEAKRRRTLALAELMRVLADDAPLALLIDDLHWADPSSRHILDAVLGRLMTERILVVTAARPVPGTAAPGRAARIELLPLDLDQLSALLASLGALPEDLVGRLPQLVRQASTGSPLLALESLQMAMDAGLLELDDGTWRSPDPDALAHRLSTGSAVRDRIAQLQRTQAWVLGLLATAGLPISREVVARAAGRSRDSVGDDLDELERRGFVQRTPDGWEPAHDAMGEASVAAMSTEAQRAADLALGHALAHDTAAPSHIIARAVQLLSTSDETALRELFRRWVFHRRRLGDRRRPRALANELLGTEDPGQVRALVRALPIAERITSTPARLRLAAGGLVVAAAFSLGTIFRGTAPPDAMLLVAGTEPSGATNAYAVALRGNDWQAAASIEVHDGTRHAEVADAATWYATAGTYDGVTWARSVTSDSGSVDVAVRSPRLHDTWITTGPADENFEDWSPDGRFVAITTGRWHSRSLYDIATVEVDTRTIRQLTEGDGHDLSARWSPDGSRIAFVRRLPLTGGPDQVCWVSVDGRDEACQVIPPHTVFDLAWRSVSELLVVYSDQGERATGRLDLAAGTWQTTGIRGAQIYPSPDGQWVVCSCLLPGDQRLRWYVFPSDRPEQARAVAWGDLQDTPLRFYWMNSPKRTGVLESLAIDPMPGTIPVGAVMRPTTVGRDDAGRVVRTPVIRWGTSDSSIALVRGDGAILTRRTGEVTLTASAGGWRAATTTIRIGEDTARVVVHETWDDEWLSRWQPYGDPRPIVVEDGDQPAMLVNGDGSHFSGLYSRAALASMDGVGVEAEVRTPLTAAQWQHLNINLSTPADTARLSSWDHRSGMVPDLNTPPRTCSAGVSPQVTGRDSLEMGMSAAGSQRVAALPWNPAEPRWYRIRLQILADGRCGIAVNGQPLWISSTHLPTSDAFRVDISGQTVGSRLLVRSIEAWEGVRMDVDWSTIERNGLTAGRSSDAKVETR